MINVNDVTRLLNVMKEMQFSYSPIPLDMRGMIVRALEGLLEERKGLEAQVPSWISMEERLPDVGTMVLVHDRSRAYVVERTGNNLFEDEYGFCHYFDDYAYWMALPKPPKEDA